MPVVCTRLKGVIGIQHRMLQIAEMPEIVADIPSAPWENLPLEETGGVFTTELLSCIEQGCPFQEEKHGRVIVPVTLALYGGADARLVVVFQETQLVVVCRIYGLLEVHVVQPVAQHHFTAQIAVEALPDVVLILHVESFIGFGIPGAAEALSPNQIPEALVHRLTQPDAAGPYFFDEAACHIPETDRNEGRHITAEPVYDLRPLTERLNLIIPESRDRIIQIDDIGPIADLIAGAAVFIVIIKLRMLLQQYRVGRGMIIHHIDHTFHAAPVDFLHQGSEVLHCAIGRVNTAVIAVCIRTAEAAFLSNNTDGVDRHEPDDVRPQRLDPVQIRNDREEGSLFGMRPDINGINHLLLQVDVGISRHDEPPVRRYRDYTSFFPSRSIGRFPGRQIIT